MARKSPYMIKIQQFKYLYDKIYTIGYYSGFYSTLRDKIWANGSHLNFCVRRQRSIKLYLTNVCMSSFNFDNQKFILLKISLSFKSCAMDNQVSFWFILYYIIFWKTNLIYNSSIFNKSFKIMISLGYIISFILSSGPKFRMTTICSNFICQSAVKARIIANCLYFVM